MAGPTSVSALIHAATMVTAGVYLAARAGPIFYNIVVQLGQPTYFFEVIAWVGAFTTFMAATQAVVSKELKKLLAYSTISQIGYMMLGIGAGGLASEFVTGMSAGIFHLMTHALFKAAAFLAAGAVLHSVESRFMGDMGGLRKSMKITFISMLVAMLALSGVPPLSGFWSKDAIITVSRFNRAITTHAPGLGNRGVNLSSTASRWWGSSSSVPLAITLGNLRRRGITSTRHPD